MLVRFKTGRVHWALIAVMLLALITFGCREPAQPGDSSTEAAGEPEQYSATVIRTIEVGATRETNISREARAGQQRWEEWTENGKTLALIWSTDIGKAFLLDLDRRVYVEIDMSGAPLPGSLTDARKPREGSGAQSGTDLNVSDSTVQTIDRYFVETQSPTNIETQTLPSVVIDGHPCVVYQQRATFPDGHTETTRRFHARDLSGLLLRVESEGDQGSSRITTERRDVRIEAAPERFIVPADFKKVESLSR